tara:strand:- start:4487 stop:5068 length:582 start_codon:yes stop_codon:yes gene_type:complete
MASTLLPFRQVHENDVVNLFAYDGSAATRGLIVKLDTGNGWKLSDDFGLSAVSSQTYTNTVTDRYNVKGKVQTCTSGDTAFGMLMYDVAETDENGEKLVFHPRKAHEMQVSVSGQAVPVLTKGIVLVKMDSADANSVDINAGTEAYAGDSGAIIANGSAPAALKRIGTFLGPRDTNGEVLVKLDFNGVNDHGA